MIKIRGWITNIFQEWGFTDTANFVAGSITMILTVLLLSVLADWIAKRVILRIVSTAISKTKTTYDDILLKRRVLDRLAHIAPALVIYASATVMFPKSTELQSLVIKIAVAYLTFIAALVIDASLNVAKDILGKLEAMRNKPIQTYVQVIKVIVYSISIILIIATLINRSPWALLSGLGAMTAILLLVFKDSIMGFVASIQISAYDLVKVGDWISFPKYGADGDVMDISLNVITIQNWDKTITTIPTYAFISDAFKNWRGMSNSGGRRIKRAINIDMNSVKFCNRKILEKFSKINLLRDYIVQKLAEVEKYNATVDSSIVVNTRQLTNLGTFRAYVERYLRSHPQINQDLTLLVRQLPPSELGIPIELYCFSKDQRWAQYEGIQADIFDHLLSIVPQFDLQVFQNPSGRDFVLPFLKTENA